MTTGEFRFTCDLARYDDFVILESQKKAIDYFAEKWFSFRHRHEWAQIFSYYFGPTDTIIIRQKLGTKKCFGRKTNGLLSEIYVYLLVSW